MPQYLAGQAQTISIGPITDESNAELTVTDLAIRFSRAGGAFVARDSGDAITSLGNGFYAVPLSAADCAAGLALMDVQSSSISTQLQFAMDIDFVSAEYMTFKQSGTLPAANVASVEGTDATDYFSALIAALATQSGLDGIAADIAALDDISSAGVQAAAAAAITAAGLATSANVAALNDLDSAAVQAAVVAALTAEDVATASDVSGITPDTVVTDGLTFAQLMRILGAVHAGTSRMLSAGVYQFKALDGVADIVRVTVNSDSERTDVSLTPDA